MRFTMPGGNAIEADEVNVVTSNEPPCEYVLADGSVVRVRVVVQNVARLRDTFDPLGRPCYHVNMTAVTSVHPAPTT